MPEQHENRCPDCGQQYDDETYFCPDCTAEYIAEGVAPHDAKAGRVGR